MNRKKKILIVSSEFPPEPGGIGNHALNLAKELSKENFEVTVLTDQRMIDFSKELAFDASMQFDVVRIRLRKMRMLMYVVRIYQIFRLSLKHSKVIASGKFSLWFVGVSSFFIPRKFIAVIHGTEVNFTPGLKKKSIDFFLKRFHKVIAVSNYTKSLVASIGLKNIEVIPNGFDIQSDKNEKVEKLKGNPSLITVGSVSERKGQMNVINVLPELIKKYPEVHYHIVGKPIEKETCLKRAKELSVIDHITFYGAVSDEEKMTLLKGSDIFTMLSENTSDGDVEGFGIALLEANYLGVPTIGSKDCGIEDAIDDYLSGILVINKHQEEIVKAVTQILENHSKFQEAAKKWSLHFTWGVIAKKYIKSLDF